MEFEDKLKRLRKEREARSRSQKVRDVWDKIDKDEEVSVKEKLERLISLTKKEKKEKEKKPEDIGAEPLPREPLLFFENPYPLEVRYGKIPLRAGLEVKGEALAYLSRNKEFESLDLSTSLFIDLETTGLSGGVGVVPFLTGLGFYRDEKFNIVQFFLGDLAVEEKMIEELSNFFSEMNFQSVVTFNGKGFDMPLLETRFTLHRKPFPLADLPHLDFLFSARSLWRHKYESCRLFYLAQQIVEADRADDIPAAEIPIRYFEFLRSGNFDLMEPVIYHNKEDILSLLGVVIIGAMLFSEDKEALEESGADAMDMFGVGKLFETAGDAEKSALFYQRALEGKLSEKIALLAKKKLSYYFKKSMDWDKAISLWQDLSSLNQLFCYRELAMYYEHKEKKYEEAKKIAEEGLALSLGVSLTYEQDFAHRLQRVKEKICKQKEKAEKP